MTAHVVQIGKHRFVCGLFWQSLSRPRELRKEATELARRVKLDLMVLRNDFSSAQVGYASSADGVRGGMLSLAAAIGSMVAQEGAHYEGRRQAVHNWLGAFSLPDGRWAYFAVRDENFLPTGDFSGSKEEVVERLMADYALGGWNVVFGDEEVRSIGFHNFHARRVQEFLPLRRNGQVKVSPRWAIEPVAQTRRIALLATAVVASAAVASAAWVLVDQHRRADSRRNLDAAMNAARKLAQKDAGPPPPHPWPGQALPSEFLQRCEQHLQHIAPGGWAMSGYECNLTQAQHAWKRQGSAVAQLLAEVPDATVAPDGASARATQSLGAAPSRLDEPLQPSREVLASVVSDLQMLGLAPRVVPVPVPPPKRDANGAVTSAAPDWQTWRLSVDAGGLAPTTLAESLGRPGVRLTKATFNGEDWSIEGVIYAK